MNCKTILMLIAFSAAACAVDHTTSRFENPENEQAIEDFVPCHTFNMGGSTLLVAEHNDIPNAQQIRETFGYMHKLYEVNRLENQHRHSEELCKKAEEFEKKQAEEEALKVAQVKAGLQAQKNDQPKQKKCCDCCTIL